MRLINAEKLMEKFDQLKPINPTMTKDELVADLVKMVEAQPTAYDVDKVVEDLEELRDGNYDLDCCPYTETSISCDKCHMIRAIDIVRRGGYHA